MTERPYGALMRGKSQVRPYLLQQRRAVVGVLDIHTASAVGYLGSLLERNPIGQRQSQVGTETIPSADMVGTPHRGHESKPIQNLAILPDSGCISACCYYQGSLTLVNFA